MTKLSISFKTILNLYVCIGSTTRFSYSKHFDLKPIRSLFDVVRVCTQHHPLPHVVSIYEPVIFEGLCSNIKVVFTNLRGTLDSIWPLRLKNVYVKIMLNLNSLTDSIFDQNINCFCIRYLVNLDTRTKR